MNLLELKGVEKIWRPRGLFQPERSVAALRGVDLSVAAGEVVGLIGESGCGKTTLSRVALGLLPVDAGEVRLFGQRPAQLPAAARRRAQLLLQNAGAALNPGLRLRALLADAARLHRPGASGVVEAALARVDLEARADAFPDALSGGEKRRVTLALLWIAQPQLVVADEPTAGLDAARKAALLDLLLADRSPGFLLISHDLPLILYACTRVVVMHAGQIVDGFVPADVYAPDRHPWTRHLLTAAGMEPGSSP